MTVGTSKTRKAHKELMAEAYNASMIDLSCLGIASDGMANIEARAASYSVSLAIAAKIKCKLQVIVSCIQFKAITWWFC